jgi:hypothetical protein
MKVHFNKGLLWQRSASMKVHFDKGQLRQRSTLMKVHFDKGPFQQRSTLTKVRFIKGPLRQRSASTKVRFDKSPPHWEQALDSVAKRFYSKQPKFDGSNLPWRKRRKKIWANWKKDEGQNGLAYRERDNFPNLEDHAPSKVEVSGRCQLGALVMHLVKFDKTFNNRNLLMFVIS